MKAICHSVNVEGMLILLGGGGNTSMLHVVMELFVLRSGGDPKT